MKFFKKSLNKEIPEKASEDNIFDLELKSLREQLSSARYSLEYAVEDVLVKEGVRKLYPSYTEFKSDFVLLAENNSENNLILAKKAFIESLAEYESARKNYNGFLNLNKPVLNTTNDYVISYQEGLTIVENTYKDFYRKLARY